MGVKVATFGELFSQHQFTKTRPYTSLVISPLFTESEVKYLLSYKVTINGGTPQKTIMKQAL